MNLEKLNFVELNAQEVQETEGGFIPLVIFGIKISASCVTGLFCTGVGVGAAVAATQSSK